MKRHPIRWSILLVVLLAACAVDTAPESVNVDLTAAAPLCTLACQ